MPRLRSQLASAVSTAGNEGGLRQAQRRIVSPGRCTRRRANRQLPGLLRHVQTLLLLHSRFAVQGIRAELRARVRELLPVLSLLYHLVETSRYHRPGDVLAGGTGRRLLQRRFRIFDEGFPERSRILPAVVRTPFRRRYCSDGRYVRERKQLVMDKRDEIVKAHWIA